VSKFVEINTPGGSDSYVFVDLEKVVVIRVKKDPTDTFPERVTAVLAGGVEQSFCGEAAVDFLDRFRGFANHLRP
jgi:hypothetical protein